MKLPLITHAIFFHKREPFNVQFILIFRWLKKERFGNAGYHSDTNREKKTFKARFHFFPKGHRIQHNHQPHYTIHPFRITNTPHPPSDTYGGSPRTWTAACTVST